MIAMFVVEQDCNSMKPGIASLASLGFEHFETP